MHSQDEDDMLAGDVTLHAIRTVAAWLRADHDGLLVRLPPMDEHGWKKIEGTTYVDITSGAELF